MKRLKIVKSYLVLWLFIYFIIHSNLEEIIIFFTASLTFNIAVLTLTVIGIIVILRATFALVMLAGTFGTLAYKKENLEFYLQGIDKIMPANIAHMFHSRAEKGVLLFTAEESRAVIEWIEEKFSHQNRYINYFTGTVLMIGLLGTFSGLLVAIDEMGRIILSLTGDIDLGEVIRSFSGPLGGMAVGFGSSLFGVVAAIIMGVMGYILNKNQEMLIEGVEDWLKGRIIDTPMGSVAPAAGVPVAEAEQLPDHRNSFMDVFIDTIASLTKEMANIAQTNERLHTITIASVQTARDEHEQNYEIFERINDNIAALSKTTQERSTALEDKLQTQSGFIEELVTLQKSLIEATQQNITNLLEKLQNTHESDKQAQQELQEKLGAISAQLEKEQETLANLEKIGKISVNDIRKLSSSLVTLDENTQKALKEIKSTIESLKETHNEQTSKLLTGLEKQLEEHLATRSLTQQNSQQTTQQLEAIQETLQQLQQATHSDTKALITTLEENVADLLVKKIDVTTTAQTNSIISKLEQSHAEIERQTEFLQSVVQNSHESLETLHTIAQKESTTIVQNGSEKSGGFFSKLFK